MPGIPVQSPVDNRGFDVKQVLGSYHPSQSIFAIRQDPQIRVLSSTAASENGLHSHLYIRIQVSHHGECLAAALRCLNAPGENPKLMPLGRPSVSCFNECAIDSSEEKNSTFPASKALIRYFRNKR
jgi:hypothetical protein